MKPKVKKQKRVSVPSVCSIWIGQRNWKLTWARRPNRNRWLKAAVARSKFMNIFSWNGSAKTSQLIKCKGKEHLLQKEKGVMWAPRFMSPILVNLLRMLRVLEFNWVLTCEGKSLCHVHAKEKIKSKDCTSNIGIYIFFLKSTDIMFMNRCHYTWLSSCH